MSASGILQGSNAIFYLPCDQLPAQEIIQTKIWTDQGDWTTAPPPSVTLQSGIVGSGFSPSGSAVGFVLTHPSTAYTDITNASGLCIALWGKGANINQNFEVNIGFGNDISKNVDNGISLVSSLGVTSIAMFASGQMSLFKNITQTLQDPSLLIIDIRFSGGTTWAVRQSLNGNDWSSLAPFNISWKFDNSAFVKLAFNTGNPSTLAIDEVILWSDTTLFTAQELSNLFTLGNVLSQPATAYTSNFGAQPASGLIDIFIAGSGIEQIATTTNLFINGVMAKPSVVCPALDLTASIQLKDSLIKIYQSRIDALINQLGTNVHLEFDPILTPCPNCTFDRIRKRSTGIFIPGGPRPFQRGRKCPWCKGRGLLETQVKKCIKCLAKWNPRDAANFGISVSKTKGIVRLKTFLTEADDLIRAKTVLAEFDISNQLELRVRLIKGPIPVGLREDRYCISFWELI